MWRRLYLSEKHTICGKEELEREKTSHGINLLGVARGGGEGFAVKGGEDVLFCFNPL